MAKSTLFRLLLMQMIYEMGDDSFTDIATALTRHPLLRQHKEVTRRVTPSECIAELDEMIREESLERTPYFGDDVLRKKRPDWVHKLAESQFMAYTEELMTLIKKDEDEFRTAYEALQKIQSKG